MVGDESTGEGDAGVDGHRRGAVAVEGGLSWLAAVDDLDPWLAVGQ